MTIRKSANNIGAVANRFHHRDLILPKPDFGSSITGAIIELEKLRNLPIRTQVHPSVFFQLKEIFQMLESLASARIEGNRTTLVDIIEEKIKAGSASKEERIREIINIEQAMQFVEKEVRRGTKLNHDFVLELHKQVVNNLTPPPDGEGDQYPGQYRKEQVVIKGSSHVPPTPVQVRTYMDELFMYANKARGQQYDLLVAALTHHRFTWIHPFRNGNGRVVRLLTYAQLVGQGYAISEARIINPAAVFCSHRKEYYELLEEADKGDPNGLLSWADYVLHGLLKETQKLEKLLDKDYLVQKILLPSIDSCRINKAITPLESAVLKIATEDDMVLQAKDIALQYPKMKTYEISRLVHTLKEKGLIMPLKRNGRKYVLKFHDNVLLREVVRILEKEGMCN